MSDDTIIFKTYKLRGARGWVPGMGTGSFTISKRSQTDKPRKQEIADKLLEFLRACPGTVVRLSGMGARSKVSWPQHCLLSVPRQPLCRAHELDCARAAAVNAVFACSGEQSAYAIASAMKQDHRVLYCFKELGEIFHRAKGKRTRCTIVKPQALQREIQKRERQAAFKALATKKSGVFMIRLLQDKVVDHVVVVDAEKKCIVDSEEETAVALTAANLMRCGGEEATELRVAEVREIISSYDSHPN